MSYLTYEEYQQMGFNKITDQEQFDRLEADAQRQLNRMTSDYYLKNSLEEDCNEYRIEKFKTAVAIQIEYLYLNGGKTTLHELLSGSPSSVSVGRMRVEAGNTNSATYGRTMIASEAYAELLFTGLLYRGVDYR
ncbi:hypothetical protein DW624_RS00740 [Enterococcus hirae]